MRKDILAVAGGALLAALISWNAQAMPLAAPAALKDASESLSHTENVCWGCGGGYGYGYGGYGYGGYGYYRPYYRPAYYGGYGYRPYYRPYGYGYGYYRPYYRPYGYYRPYYRPYGYGYGYYPRPRYYVGPFVYGY
jgi:hypothetical protein